VFEIRATQAIPYFSTVLLMCSPITFHCKCFAALSAHVGFYAMLSLVVCLKSSEILQRPCSWVVNVVLATCCTTKAWKPQHSCWLCSFQRIWPLSVLRSMPPHMHLKIKLTPMLSVNCVRNLTSIKNIQIQFYKIELDLLKWETYNQKVLICFQLLRIQIGVLNQLLCRKRN